MLIQKIFIASPGDVCDERNLAKQVIDRIRGERLFRGKVDLQVIAWDQPGVEVPMDVAMTPQKAIESGLPKPSECDIVIVLLWSRIGTLLPPEYTKPDGERYLSGTEWEFCDALAAAKDNKSPVIWVYRRLPPPASRLDDKDLDHKREQWKKLQTFFDGFNNEDESINGGVNPYESPDQFQRLWEQHLRDRLTQLVSAEPLIPKSSPQQDAEVTQQVWEGAPYPGLEAFSPNQWPIYFGRGAETDDLVHLFSQPDVRFVAVVGASGSGKSSLVSAGLWPRLQGGALPGSANWHFVRLSPTEKGNDPFVALAAALKALGMGEGEREADFAQTLAADHNYLSNNLPKHLEGQPKETELLLFCDQFEELFSTPVTEERRQDFIDFLANAAKTAKVRIALTMRAEFYARALDYGQLAGMMRATSTFPLAAPGAGALLEMIEGPARIAGLQMKRGLASSILDDTGTAPGVLPLMAFALSELFKESQKQNQESHQLTFAHYQAIGKVKGAIKKRSDDAFKGLGKDSDKLLDKIFPALVNLDQNGIATRKRADWAPFEQDDSLKILLDKLIDARLLVTSELPNAQVEIAHESLLESWPQLHDWLNLNREALSARRVLEAVAQAWRQSGKPRWNASGAILECYRRAASIPETAQEFFAVCRSSQRRDKFVRIGFAFFTVFFITLIGFQVFINKHDISSKAGIWVALAYLGISQPAEPEMVDIPPGSFRPGWDKSTEKDFKQPPEPVAVQAFKMGKYEVTFDQYDVFRVIKDYPKPLAGWGRDDRPVIDVSWKAATAYIEWLKEMTGKNYHLPDELQWEYAARGNQDPPTVYPWGDEMGENKANNCRDCGNIWDDKGTAPVGSFPAYGFGLHDTSGNVEEWMQDCYDQVEDDKQCPRRVLRGGSWYSGPGSLRSAYRDSLHPAYRSHDIGFRLAQN